MAGPLGPMWLLLGRGRFDGSRVAAVGASPVPWVPCGRRGNVSGRLGPVWLLLFSAVGRGRSSGPRVAAV